MHTNLSPDSDVEIDRFAEQAVELGIDEIAITDHVDFDPRAPAYAYATFEQRERLVRDTAERWGPRGVVIRFGVELTYESAFEDDIRAHLRRHDYDFVIGSVHPTVDSPYRPSRVAEWLAGRSFVDAVAPYFDEVLAGARSGLFDAFGHIDFVKRFVAPTYTAADFAGVPELYEPILRALVDTGTALEINTSGLRQPAQETYPSAEMVAWYRELGGARLTVGSDAHRADQFAWALADGYATAAAVGLAPVLPPRRG